MYVTSSAGLVAYLNPAVFLELSDGIIRIGEGSSLYGEWNFNNRLHLLRMLCTKRKAYRQSILAVLHTISKTYETRRYDVTSTRADK